ncbi:MAG: hypothetical protein SGILL_003389, partial [Bacillariaceae sp.]
MKLSFSAFAAFQRDDEDNEAGADASVFHPHTMNEANVEASFVDESSEMMTMDFSAATSSTTVKTTSSKKMKKNKPTALASLSFLLLSSLLSTVTVGATPCIVDLDFEEFVNGQYITDDLFDSSCVTITTVANAGGLGGAARVFDSFDHLNTCDEDLISPSPKFFGHPAGVHFCSDCCGGGPYLMDPCSSGTDCDNGCKLRGGVQTPNPYKNQDNLGNLLIIQEDNGSNTCPDDSRFGGDIIFEFCRPVTILAGKILDNDRNENANVTFFYEDGTHFKEEVDNVGDNGVFTGNYNEEHVTKFVFSFKGSGSVAGLTYSVCDVCPEALTPVALNFDNVGLENGDYVSSNNADLDALCVSVSAVALNAAGIGFDDLGPRVFDTSNPSDGTLANGFRNCDPDLSQPNDDIGNVLIMQNAASSLQATPPGTQECVDDSNGGAEIIFDFTCGPVDISEVTILDLDTGSNSESATLTFMGGSTETGIVVPAMGDGQLSTLSFDPVKQGVTQLKVVLSGSGAVAEVKYIACITPDEPTSSPTGSPTGSPTSSPTASPTSSPTSSPTASPTSSPTASPTSSPTSSPTASPTASPTSSPTASPTASPTSSPTASPTASPTSSPTASPTSSPTASPTSSPTSSPTASPTSSPTSSPTEICDILVTLTCESNSDSAGFPDTSCDALAPEVDLICECADGVDSLTFIYNGADGATLSCTYEGTPSSTFSQGVDGGDSVTLSPPDDTTQITCSVDG